MSLSSRLDRIERQIARLPLDECPAGGLLRVITIRGGLPEPLHAGMPGLTGERL